MQSTIPATAREAANYGLRARFGIMLPASNTVVEPLGAAILPPGVSLHATRLMLHAGPGALSMLDRLEEATQLLADARVDRLIFHCTAITMHAPEMPEQIRRRIAAITPLPVTITSETIVAALRAFGARKIVLVTPYDQGTNDREARFLAHHGITVLRDRALGCDDGVAMGAVEPRQWIDETIAMRDPEADAYFLSCTQIRAAEAIEPIERALGKPVVTSNQGMLWGALRDAGIADPVDGYGRLLREF
jgi:maleate cis-trans isomerase